MTKNDSMAIFPDSNVSMMLRSATPDSSWACSRQTAKANSRRIRSKLFCRKRGLWRVMVALFT